ncbi:glucan endo-1,3-beta-glucosidase 4-like isoform X2 [Phragmites australis]|nr:glucan endo-1,3-beta-glucosidase 4-like isoform X2 [Phragmites australis]
MLDKRLQGCLLLLIFLLTKASGSLSETIINPEQALAPTLSDSVELSLEGKRRSLATGSSGMFCVALQGADPAALQVGLNWACGQGHADCTAIQPGGPCYKQNNLPALASYAYNDYYHKNANAGAICSFNGTATTTTTDPSSGQCVFAGSSMAGGSTPTASAPSGLAPPSSFTPGTGGFGNGSTFGSPTGALIPLDGAESLLSGARRVLCAMLLVLPLFFF